MKKLLIILTFTLSLSAGATTRYVSTTGSDAAAGTAVAPWLTWQKGFSSLVAGDTLYIRGGIYSPTGTYLYNRYSGVAINNIDGTAINPIVVTNYPGEVPILNGVNITDVNSRAGVHIAYSDYWHIKGLTVRNVAQYHNVGEPWYGSGGFMFTYSDHIKIENCVAHHIGGSGFWGAASWTDMTITNCDSYANDDPYSQVAYDGADGFAFTSDQPSGLITFTGCRAWNNSDDGYDGYGTYGLEIFDKCWAWANGYAHGTTNLTGNGNGIKLGSTPNYSTTVKRVVTNCVSFNNSYAGIIQNAAQCIMYFYNNSVYANLKGIEIYSFQLVHQVKNNISFGNSDNYSDDGGSAIVNTVITNNSYDANWQPSGPSASTADFVSVDTAGVSRARNSAGSLPILTFLHLVSGSDLKDAGADIGLDEDAYGNLRDALPDIGAFEYGASPPTTNRGYGKVGGKFVRIRGIFVKIHD